MRSEVPHAFLVHDQKLYVPGASNPSSAGTPVTLLIEAICARFPNQSRKILRERIFTCDELTPFCQGMIKVAAKRASILNEAAYLAYFEELKSSLPTEEVTLPELSPQQIAHAPERFSSLLQAAEFAQSLSSLSDRAIGAVLISESGELLHYGWNTNLEIRTQHAEMNLIRSLAEKGLTEFPQGTKLVVTLKPCAMCAAAILRFSNPTAPIPVIYLKDDPGPKAKNSVLMKGSELWLKAGEPSIELTHFDLDKKTY